MSPTRKKGSPIRLDHNIPPVYMRGNHHLANLLSSGDGGQPTKIKQASDSHMLICQPFQKKKEVNKGETRSYDDNFLDDLSVSKQ